MHSSIFIPLLLAASLVRCKDNSESRSPSLTNEELLRLMKGELFEVTIPSDIDPEQFAGLAIHRADGSIDTMSSSNAWTPGQTVKIVCFAPDKNEFRYACFREGGIGSGSTTNFPITEQSSPNMKRLSLKPGDRLMRYSIDNRMTMSEQPQDDDFDLIFHVQEKKKAQQAVSTIRR
jgi:hypothetical protein